MILVYAGPSLSQLDPEKGFSENSNVLFKAPVEAGDIWNHLATLNNITDILIIDGYFYSKLAVLHSEILEAIASGVRVHGCASLGALRAVELTDRGMIGHGKIYDFYRSYPQTGDDEVAVLHSPEAPYQTYTVPLINIRILHNEVSDVHYKRAISKVLHQLEMISFSKRSWKQISKICIDQFTVEEEGFELFNRIQADYIDYKFNDAVETLHLLIDSSPPINTLKPDINYNDNNKLKNQFIQFQLDSESDQNCNLDQLTSLLRLSAAFSPTSFAIEHFKDIVFNQYKDSFVISEDDIDAEIFRINSKIKSTLSDDLGIKATIQPATAHWAKVNLVFNHYIKEKIDENEIYFVNHLLFRSMADSGFEINSDIDSCHLINLKKALDFCITTKNDIHDPSILKTFSMIAKLKISQFWDKALITRFNDYKKILRSLLTH